MIKPSSSLAVVPSKICIGTEITRNLGLNGLEYFVLLQVPPSPKV